MLIEWVEWIEWIEWIERVVRIKNRYGKHARPNVWRSNKVVYTVTQL